jgi:phosphorylated CTD-interacting factor 1
MSSRKRTSTFNSDSDSKRTRTEMFYDQSPSHHNNNNTSIAVEQLGLNEYVRNKYHLTTPIPSIELLRSQMMQSLREKQVQLITNKIGIDAPKESFNRWLMERKMLEKIHGLSHQQQLDPLLPSICLSEQQEYISETTSVSLAREILEDIPLKVNMFPKDTFDAKRSLSQYLHACQKMATRHKLTESDCENIKNVSNETTRWLTGITDPQSEKIIVTKLEEVKKEIGGLFRTHLKQLVDDVCTELAVYGHELVQKLNNSIKDHKTSDRVNIRHNNYKHIVDVRYGDFYATINTSHYNKLLYFYSLRENVLNTTTTTASTSTQQQSYNNNNMQTKNMDKFHNALACLLIRYMAFFSGKGGTRYEGSGLQAALPEELFRFLRDEFSVSMECFASPLNCFFGNFCSAFPDIDYLFGSVNNFFEFKPTSGSFEANPPFTEELMVQMVQHMEQLLSATNEPLSFIIFVPNWTDASSLQKMQDSKYLSKDLVLSANEHSYVNGFQHTAQQHKRNYVAVHETHVYFLQNESACEKWKVTDEKTNQLKQLFSSERGDQ